MRSKILPLQRSAVLLFKRQYAMQPDRCDAHMNELPVPCKPWQPWYNDRQSFYSKHLALGIMWWLFSFGMAIYTDSIYLNWSPPAQPSAPNDMEEECDES